MERSRRCCPMGHKGRPTHIERIGGESGAASRHGPRSKGHGRGVQSIGIPREERLLDLTVHGELCGGVADPQVNGGPIAAVECRDSAFLLHNGAPRLPQTF